MHSRSSLSKNQRCRSPSSKHHSKKRNRGASQAETETLAEERSDLDENTESQFSAANNSYIKNQKFQHSTDY